MSKLPLIPVIICGGRGTRLWPISNINTPKPFLALPNGSTLFYAALERALNIANNKIIILANKQHQFIIKKHLTTLNNEQQQKIIVIYEPIARNTAPAIMTACWYIQQLYPQGSIMQLLTSDHIIEPATEFKNTILETANNLPADQLILFGIKPNSAKTDYGYIQTNHDDDNIKTSIIKFIEKPNQKEVDYFITQKGYFWNSGLLLAHTKKLIELFKTLKPNIYSTVLKSLSINKQHPSLNPVLTNDYQQAENISIDYAILEKCKNISMIKANWNWQDIGTIDNYNKLFSKDSNGNSINCQTAIVEGCKRISINNDNKNKKIIAIDIDDTLIIEREDTLVICNSKSFHKISKYYPYDTNKLSK